MPSEAATVSGRWMGSQGQPGLGDRLERKESRAGHGAWACSEMSKTC